MFGVGKVFFKGLGSGLFVVLILYPHGFNYKIKVSGQSGCYISTGAPGVTHSHSLKKKKASASYEMLNTSLPQFQGEHVDLPQAMFRFFKIHVMYPSNYSE